MLRRTFFAALAALGLLPGKKPEADCWGAVREYLDQDRPPLVLPPIWTWHLEPVAAGTLVQRRLMRTTYDGPGAKSNLLTIPAPCPLCEQNLFSRIGGVMPHEGRPYALLRCQTCGTQNDTRTRPADAAKFYMVRFAAKAMLDRIAEGDQ